MLACIWCTGTCFIWLHTSAITCQIIMVLVRFLCRLIRSLCWLVRSLSWLVTYSFVRKWTLEMCSCPINAIQITTKLSDKSPPYMCTKNVERMQPTKLFPGLRTAILTFQIHKLWRRFLRIETPKDKGPFLMTSVNWYLHLSFYSACWHVTYSYIKGQPELTFFFTWVNFYSFWFLQQNALAIHMCRHILTR